MISLVSILALPAAAATINATPTQSAVRINGAEKKFEAFYINGNSYFKLRDIAYALGGTAKQFQVIFDEPKKQIDLFSHTAYTAVGNEMAVSGLTKSVAATPAVNDIYLDGVKLTLTAYLIDKANYIKLRDLAAAVDFGVKYTAENDTINIDTSTVYVPDSSAAAEPSNLNLTLIGDSIGIGITPYLKKYYPNLYADAKVSRQFSEAKSIIQQMLQDDELGPVVVIELGTNGTITESQLRQVIKLIGSDRKIVFVNIQVARSWCLDNNKTLEKVTAEFSNTVIADWYSASVNKSTYFYKDGIHLSVTGSLVMAKVIEDAVSAIQQK